MGGQSEERFDVLSAESGRRRGRPRLRWEDRVKRDLMCSVWRVEGEEEGRD